MISELLASDGDTVTVGQVIGRIEAGEAVLDTTMAAIAPVARDAAEDRPAASDGAAASPVARRAADAHSVDLTTVAGSGPRGRITKADVLDAAGQPAAEASGGVSDGDQGRSGDARPLHGGESQDSDSDELPHARGRHLDARRGQLKQAGKKVSFTHLIAFAVARAAAALPVMAQHFAEIDAIPHRLDDGAVNLGLAVDVERRDGSRALMVPVVRDAGNLAFDAFLAAYDDLVERARTNSLTADDLQGANITLTNPGGIGTSASVPRLMEGQGTIVAAGAIAYPPGLAAVGAQLGAEKVMTLTSTYDHRVIQGAESGRFLALVESLLGGADSFYEAVFAALGSSSPRRLG